MMGRRKTSDTVAARSERIELFPSWPDARMNRRGMSPKDMDRMPVTPEQKHHVEKLVLGIFADMSNAHYSLAETLTAVYISGVVHALESIKDNKNE